MPIAAYPTPDLSESNPKYGSFISLPDEYQVTVSDFDDGGRDYALQAGGSPIKVWQIEYPTLLISHVAILDGHVNSSLYSPENGSALGFQFFDRDTGLTHANVHYAPGGYVRGSHQLIYIQARSVILIKHP